MRKRFIITESEKNEIRRMYGLITEQSTYSDGMIPAKGYKIIEDIEENMGTAKQDQNGNWVPGSTPNKGDKLEGVIKTYINDCLTDNNWLKIDPIFRLQIYSFMFQAGSDEGKRYRWIAGLGQAINPNYDRLKIIGDEAVRKQACQTINNAIKDGTINSFYEKYITVVKQQYNGLTTTKYSDEELKNIKAIAWNRRPDVIEDMFKTGKSIQDVMNIYFDSKKRTLNSDDVITSNKNEFYKKVEEEKNSQTNQNKQQNNQPNTITTVININISDSSLAGYDKFATEIKTKTLEKSIDISSIDLDFENRTFSCQPGNEKIYKVLLVIGRPVRDGNGKIIPGNESNKELQKRIDSIKSQNQSFQFDPVGLVGNCSDCTQLSNGTDEPMSYQLFVMKKK